MSTKLIENEIEKIASSLEGREFDKLVAMLPEFGKDQLVSFVKAYKPLMPPENNAYESALLFAKQNKIKITKKRKFGPLTIVNFLRGGNELRNTWLNFTSTINKTIYLSNSFEKKTDLEKAITLYHEFNHVLLWRKIGKVIYNATYLANVYSRLAIELCCYKVQYEYSIDKKEFIKNLAVKMNTSYEVTLQISTIEDLIKKAYNQN